MSGAKKYDFSAFDDASKQEPKKEYDFSSFDGIVKKKDDGQPLEDGGQKKPAGTSPTKSPSQSQLPKVKWEENPLNPLAAAKKAEAKKTTEPVKFVSKATPVNVDNIKKYESSQQMYSLADKTRAKVLSKDEHSIFSPAPLIEDIGEALIPGYAESQKNKKNNEILASNQLFEETRKSAMDSQAGIKDEIPKILSPISDSWSNYISRTIDNVPKLDEYKIRDFANKTAKEYGVPENGMFYNLIKREASNLVTQKLIQPAVDNQLKVNYKKTYGRDLDADLKSESNQAAIKLEEIKTNTKLAANKLQNQISSEARNEVTSIQTDISTQVNALNDEIKIASEGIKNKYSPLIKDNKFIGTPEEFAQYQQDFATLEQKQKENKEAFDGINRKFLDEQNLIFSKANARYRREAEELSKIAQSQYEKFKPKANPQLQKNIEKIYGKSYQEVLNKNEELRKTSSYSNSLLDNFSYNLISSTGNYIKGLAESAGLESVVTFGEFLQNTYAQDVTEFKSAKDYLDLQKLAKSTGQLVGGMLPGMIGAAAVTAASGGAAAPLGWQMLSAGLTQWGVETMSSAGNMKADVLAATGDIAKANNAERQTIAFQKDILPLYAFSGLPFIGKGVTKLISKFAPAAIRATSPTIAKIAGFAERKFVAPIIGGVTEVLEETPQEYSQRLAEEAIRKEGSYANMFEYHTKEKFENTTLQMGTMFLFGGAGEMVGQSEETKKQYALQQAAKSFALKTDFANLAPGQKEQFLFDVIQRQGLPFAAAYITANYSSGQIDKATFEGLQETYAKQVKLLGQTEELGLTPVQAKLYNAFSTYHDNEKKKFDEAEDPILKTIAAARMTEYQNALTNIALQKEPNYSVVTYPDNTQMVFMHSELNNALNNSAFAEAVSNGNIKVDVFGDSEKLNTKVEETKKSVVAAKEEEQRVAKEEERNTRKEIETTFNVKIEDNVGEMGVEVQGLGTEEETEQAKQALRDAGINLREDGAQVSSQVGEEVTTEAELPKQTEIEKLRAEEQAELDTKIPNAEQYRVDGKVDRTKLTNEADIKAFDEVYDKYDKLISPLLKETKVSKQKQGVGGNVTQTTTSPTIVNVSNKTELSNLEERTKNDKNKSTVLEAAKKAIATLKSIFPDMEIFIHEDADVYNQTVVPKGGTQNSRGNFAFERDKNNIPTGKGRIDINLSNASETTVAHEVTHAILLKAFGDSPATFKQFRNRISPILRADLNKELLKFEKMYEGLEVAPEEYLTQLSALLSRGAETVEYKPSTLRKIAAVINEFVAKITGGKFQPFKGEADFKNFVDFLNQIAQAIEKGEAIETQGINGLGLSGKIEPSKVKSKSSLSSGEIKRFPVNENVKVEEDVPLSKFNGKQSNLIESDRMTGGYISDSKGNPLFKFYGGVFYPIITGKWWASRNETKARAIAENGNKNRDADGYVYCTPMIGSDKQHMSNTDMLSVTVELMKLDVNDKKSKVKKSDVISSIEKAFNRKDVQNKKGLLGTILKKSNNINEIFDELGYALFQEGDNILDRNNQPILDQNKKPISNFTFEERLAVVNTILGDPKVKDVKFPSAGTISDAAKRFEEPVTAKASAIGDVVTVMRTKGTLKYKKTENTDPFYHKSYPVEIYAVDEQGNPAEIEVYILDGAYSMKETFPSLTQSSGKEFSWSEYIEKHKSENLAVAQYNRTAKLSSATGEIKAEEGNIKSKAQLLEESNDEDIVSASVNVAPLYSTKVSNIEQAAQIHNSDFYQEYKKENERIAGFFNLKVESQLDGIGGYEFSNGQAVREATTIVNVTGKFSDIVNYAATIGALAPEVQDATIAGMYVKEGSANHTADKIEIKIDNSDAALKAVTDAGFDRAGFTLIDGEVSFFNVLDYPTKDFKEKITTFVNKYKEYGGKIIERKKHAVRSEYIDNVRRREILGRIAKSPLQYGQDRAGLRDALATAKERNTTYTTWKYLDKSESVKEYRILRQKQFDLASEGKSLSDKDAFRIAELEKRLSKILSATFKSESSIYDNAKLEVDAIAEDVAKLTEGGFRSEFAVKVPNRAAIKSVRWYDVQPNLLGDGARTNIIVNTDTDADYLFNEIDKRFSSDLDRKERENTELGYPKRLIEIRTRNGKTAEIQVITPQGYLAKDGVSRFPKDAKEKAEQSLQEVRDRLGWQIPDGVGHYFYEINRDLNVQKNLRDQAKEISIKYYYAFLNTDSKLSDAEFRKDISEFKQKVDTADKSKWDEGNTGKSPDSLNKYLGDNDGNMVSRSQLPKQTEGVEEKKTELPEQNMKSKSQKDKVDFGEGEEAKDNKKEFDKLTSTIPNSGELTKYLSGETIEKYEGEKPRNEQEVVAMQLRPALERGVDIIAKAKELFGENYVDNLLQYVETENLPPANKALIYVSLENELAKQKIENPSEAAKIEKMQDLVRAKSQAYLRSNSLAINMGRLRKFAEVGYDANKLTDRFFSSRQMEDKNKIEEALQATADDINKEAARILNEDENIKAKIDEGVNEEIQKIYENLSTEKKKTVNKRLSVLDKLKQKIFNKYIFKSKPQLAEENVKSKSSVNNIIEEGYNKIVNAIKAGVEINKAINIGIDKIKENIEKTTGQKWADEAEFKSDIIDAFKAEGLIETKSKGNDVLDRLEQAKQRVRNQIESLKEQIANKERTKKKDKLKSDAELEALIKQKDALTSLLNKYVPKVDAYSEEKNLKAAKARLENEILELNKQIQKGQKDKFEKKESKENAELDALRAEKEARQAILEALDPTPRLFIENALIEQGFGRQINVKTKDGVEKRWVLDWKKLAGEEGSVDNIRDRVESALIDKGYTDEQILRMQDAFVEEYNNLRQSIVEKAQNEIAAKNKEAVTPEQKSAVKKLVEMYNYGLFDKDPAAFETALAKTIGVSGISLENFERVKELGEAMSNLFNTSFEGQPLNESELRTAIQVIEEKMRIILNSEAMQQGTTAFKLSKIAKGYMDASQRMLLNTIKQGMENPISGLLERFYSAIGYAGKIPEQLNAQQRKMARDIYKEMVLQKGMGYGNVGSAFISKGSLDAYVHNMSDSELVQGVMSIAMGKTILDAVDSAYKAKITQQKFTYNLINILTKDRMVNGVLEKGMSKEEAKRYVAEKISGQSFEDAKDTAFDIIDKVNFQAGKKIFNDSPEFISRLATDIVNAALVNGEKITKEMVTAAYNAAYKAAGRGLGHVANNFISEQINTYSGKLESRINDAIKEKKYNKAAWLNLQSILYRNIINPFVGGGTNWVVLKAEKSGLGLVSGLASMYSNRDSKIDLTTETGMKELEDAMYNSMKTKDKFIRGAVGGAVTALAFMLIKATDADDEYEKWIKKNQWAKKYLSILTPEIMLAMLAAKSSSGYKTYLENSFNKNESFDKGKMTIKAMTALSQGEKDKAAGQAGQLLGSSIGTPIPWRLVRDGQQIWVGATGGEPYSINPAPAKSFMEGYFKGGIVDYLGFAPTSEDKTFIITKKDLNKPEYQIYKEKEIKIPQHRSINEYRVDTETGLMNEEQYNKFISLVDSYMENGFVETNGYKEKTIYGLKELPEQTFRIKQKGEPREELLGKELSKEDLQNKVNQLHEDAVEQAKFDLGLITKKPKRTVTINR